jgi:hypothetical protein
MVKVLGETFSKDGITRWFHKLIKNLYIKNSIYFALLVHRQEYRNELFSLSLWNHLVIPSFAILTIYFVPYRAIQFKINVTSFCFQLRSVRKLKFEIPYHIKKKYFVQARLTSPSPPNIYMKGAWEPRGMWAMGTRERVGWGGGTKFFGKCHPG